jgi:DNA repair photolyase
MPSAPQPVRRALDAQVRELLAPLLHDDPRSRWRVIGWDCEQGISLFVQHETRVLQIELEARRDERARYAQTARFNVNVRLLFDRGAPLEEPDRRLVDAIVATIARREHQLPDPAARPAATRRAELRPIAVDRVLMTEAPGQYYVNPYAGCTIGCPYCYVAERSDLTRALQGLPALEWGRYVDVKVNAAEVLRREAAAAPPGVVRLSPILTDPYQPAEAKHRVTRAVLEVLLEHGHAPVILTRSALVLDDLDLLRRFERAAVGFSIPTDDDAVRALFEPNADPVERRFEALRACHEAGLTTFVVIQPMLPMDTARMVAETAPYLHAIRIDRMHQLERTFDLYRHAGLEEAAQDGFFDALEGELRAAYRAHGVPVDELDDLGRLLGALA